MAALTIATPMEIPAKVKFKTKTLNITNIEEVYNNTTPFLAVQDSSIGDLVTHSLTH